MPIVEFKNVSKHFKVLNRREGLVGGLKDLFSRDYKTVKAVDGVSFSVEAGEIVGYLGPNGAGKSTTIKMMTGVLLPTSGDISVSGRVPYKDRTKTAANIGVVFGQRSQLWWSLPLIESFKILRDIYDISQEDYAKQLALYESLVDLEPLYSKPVREMSLGQRTLCDILAAFLHNPAVVFLDEPTIGLDVAMKAKIRELIHTLNRVNNTTIILTTHDIGDVDALCRRIVIIDKGVMIYDDSAENLSKFFGQYRTLKIKTDDEITYESVTITRNEEWVEIVTKEDEMPVMEILQALQKSHKISDIRIEEITTEEIIKKIYAGDGR
ncbi:MAG: ATP-binding cassette domain-containing protein [Oscillospiraceae bacterium]|jgi:ABC-2 type transport system ATP-binding protein|nr:ATP-binding cassette domain-containing protein [Oscillospiraceae bacterium]